MTTFDRTALRANKDGYRVHRDYAAHFFRWGWAVHRAGECGLTGKRVLDVCAGRELPLMQCLELQGRQPQRLVTVDLNAPSTKHNPKWHVHYQGDFTDIELRRRIWDEQGGPFDVVVCFEGIEHMDAESGDRLLTGAHQMLTDAGWLLISTPVLGKAPAHNHIHEYTIDELTAAFHRAGFVVEERYGTFANVADAKVGIRQWAEMRGVDSGPILLALNEIARYYSPDVLSCFLAPIIPDYARNNVWKLRKAR